MYVMHASANVCIGFINNKLFEIEIVIDLHAEYQFQCNNSYFNCGVFQTNVVWNCSAMNMNYSLRCKHVINVLSDQWGYCSAIKVLLTR